MKNLFAILMLAMLGMAVTFTSCKKDEDDDKESNNGTAVVDGNTVEFTQGYLLDYGETLIDGVYNFDITLTSDGIDWWNDTGTGNILYFELFTGTENFQGGTFTYNENETAGTFDYAELVVGGNYATEEFQHYYEVTAGTVTVTVNGNNYQISYSLTAQEYDADYTAIGNPTSITGSYSGPLSAYKNATTEKKNNFVKN
jgi:hypothetical protein